MGARFAIVLGGGRSSRMGRDKAALRLNGRALLQRAVEACSDRDLVVVVAPESTGISADRLRHTLEDPPFGGPVAGIAAGLEALPAASDGDEVLVLACDLVRSAEIVGVLDGCRLVDDGVCLVDAEGWPQYLAARYRRDALADALAALGEVRNVSMRRLAKPLRLSLLAGGDLTVDVDTPQQAQAFGIGTD